MVEDLKKIKEDKYFEFYEETFLGAGIQNVINEYSVDKIRQVLDKFEIKDANNIITFNDKGMPMSPIKHALLVDPPWTLKYNWSIDGNNIISSITAFDSKKGARLYKFVNEMYNNGFTKTLPNEKDFFRELYYNLRAYKVRYLDGSSENATLVEGFIQLIDKIKSKE